MNPVLAWLSGLFRRRGPVASLTMGGPVQSPARDSGGVRGPLVLHPAGRVWELPDRDDAMHAADGSGDYMKIARICDAMRADGMFRGLLDRRAGVLSFPLLYEGDPWVVDALRGSPAEYDEATGAQLSPARAGLWGRILPRPELRAMYDDGILGGAGVGYLCDDPRPGGWRALKHLDLHWLRYQHSDDSWWYQDHRRGLLRVTPGDGRWCLFTPYGRSRPWTRGLWYPASGPVISKQGASIDRLRWQRFLADGLRWMEMGETASEVHLADMVRFMREGWQYAPGLVAPKGYKPQIEEANGRGYEVYTDTEDRGDRELIVAFTGSTVSVDGAKGFGSGDIWDDVAKDLIQDPADALSQWATDEAVNPWTRAIGLGEDRARVSWDARDPRQKSGAAAAGKAAAEELDALDKIAGSRGQRVKLAPFLRDRGVEIELEDLAGPPGANVPPAGGTDPTAPTALPSPAPVAGLLPAAPLAAEDAAAPADDSAARLAEAMTKHAVPSCEHGSTNRCRICGVERERELVPGARGKPHTWRIVWRPISSAAASRTAGALPTRRLAGLTLAIEYPAGATRSGAGPDGVQWSTVMPCDYGYVLGTLGADGEPIDAYAGPDDSASDAYLVSQVHEDGSPDELKLLLGFPSEEAARMAFAATVPAWCFGSIATVPVSALAALLPGRV